MLSKYDAMWKNTQEKRESDLIDPPPGRYAVRVDSAGYSEVKGKDGLDYDRFYWKLQIIGGEHDGQAFARTEFLPPNPADAAQKIAYIKGALLACGVCPPREITDLPQSMALAVGAKLEAVVSDAGRNDKSGRPIKNIKFIAHEGAQVAPADNGTQIKQELQRAPSQASNQNSYVYAYGDNILPEEVPF